MNQKWPDFPATFVVYVIDNGYICTVNVHRGLADTTLG